MGILAIIFLKRFKITKQHNIDKNYDLLILKIRKVLKGIYVSGKIKKITGCVTGKI